MDPFHVARLAGDALDLCDRRLRLFNVPATLARTGRHLLLHHAINAPWARLATDGLYRLRALAVPG